MNGSGETEFGAALVLLLAAVSLNFVVYWIMGGRSLWGKGPWEK